MTEPDYLDTPQGRRLAYHLSPGAGPGVVFLGGLASDMEGTKALHLQAWARARGLRFLRFDYSGHGQSSGTFTEGCIGDWHQDTLAIFEALCPGPQVVVGSSMGGWQALLLAKRSPELLAGMVTIAGAPDFTEDGYWAEWSEAQRAQVMEDGQIALPSDYGQDMIVTRRMIEDGRVQSVLSEPLAVEVPVRLLQGSADADVPASVAWRLFEHLDGEDIRLELVKGADHRFSTPACLNLITRSVEEVLRGA